ncbi:hypothetical protein L1987_63396 [Smallanthus sonchifolius]|uniref:Uncharacterized protein n=1 Tax=Smallanthus sonchifolius TaxID=185202 RepID=A0ACB9CD04_9ASTR|nr:hypothetical protein L1987_63396 [Smallanthus sonchifolius]
MAGTRLLDPNSDDTTKGFEENKSHVANMIFEFVEESELSSQVHSLLGTAMTMEISKKMKIPENLYRTSSFESKIRQATKEIIKEMKSSAVGCCDCGMMAVDGCRRCFQREISDRLQRAGYNCGICKAKWNNLKQIPAGEHTYIEVMDTVKSKKGVLRVIIELNFRTEFEMIKGSQEYNRLINRLPEIYVGKTERLQSLIKILCLASKKCMKDQKMHIAPWRKLKYMQAKWDGVRVTKLVLSPDIVSMVECSSSLSRPMVSLLTFDLVDSLNKASSLHSMAIQVLKQDIRQIHKWKPHLSTPKTPPLQTLLSPRPPKIKSTEELEKEELKKAPKFKARPLNKMILESKGELGLFCNRKRQVTTPQEFHFATDERIPPPTANVAHLVHVCSLIGMHFIKGELYVRSNQKTNTDGGDGDGEKKTTVVKKQGNLVTKRED